MKTEQLLIALLQAIPKDKIKYKSWEIPSERMWLHVFKFKGVKVEAYSFVREEWISVISVNNEDIDSEELIQHFRELVEYFQEQKELKEKHKRICKLSKVITMLKKELV